MKNKQHLKEEDEINALSTCPICYNKGLKAQREEEIKWLKENRHIINGIDVLEVDKRLKKLEGKANGVV